MTFGRQPAWRDERRIALTVATARRLTSEPDPAVEAMQDALAAGLMRLYPHAAGRGEARPRGHRERRAWNRRDADTEILRRAAPRAHLHPPLSPDKLAAAQRR